MNKEQDKQQIEDKPTIFLKIEIVFKDSIGQLKLDSPAIIEVPNSVYAISVDDQSKLLKISALFSCYTYPKTLATFSEIPSDRTLCIETETDSRIRNFFDEHYYLAVNEIERLYKLLRWKYSLGYGKLTIHSENIFWSLDKENWKSIVRCPPIEDLHVTVVHDRSLDSALIKDLMENGEAEPIFFGLLREANSIKHTSLESSFVIAVAALEVAVKHLIKTHIPQSEWLMDEIPTPPIEKIIRDFFPQLIRGFSLSDEHIKVLRSIIMIRNKIVHSGKVENKRETLFKMMRFINDFIFQTINPNLK